MPDRPGRNVNPVPKTTGRRKHQDILAEKEAKRREIERRIQELEEAKRLLAATNISEDASPDYPTRLSAALRKRAFSELEGDGDGDGDAHESFDFQEADDMLTSSDDEGAARKQVSPGLLA